MKIFKHVPNYLYVKLTGAGFSFAIFVLFFTFNNSFTLFELSELLHSPWLWSAFYVYGIICSILIDCLIKKWPTLGKYILVLYLFAGFIIFVYLIIGFVYILIAGVIGALAAFLFYFGVTFINKNKWMSILFAFLVPLLFAFISFGDFTKKENWTEDREDDSYQAHFTHFNGEHKIPIQLDEGDELSYHVSFNTAGQFGDHFENERGDYLPRIEEEGRLVFTAKVDEEYYIVIRGIRAEGSVAVDWEIK